MSRKTGKEARVERITWFALVMVFAPLSLGDWLHTLPPYVVPFAVMLILLVSGLYQYRQGWRISPIVWIVAALMGAMGGYGIYAENRGLIPLVDPILVALIGTIIIIAMGVLSNES